MCITRHVRRMLIVVAVAASVAGASASPTAAFANFAGIILQGDMQMSSFTCNPDGTSTVSYTASGSSTLSYPGSFTATGSFTIGPQNLPGYPSNSFLPAGSITSWTETLTINSSSGTINATASGVVEPPAGFGISGATINTGTCLFVENVTLGQVQNATGTVIETFGTVGLQAPALTPGTFAASIAVKQFISSSSIGPFVAGSFFQSFFCCTEVPTDVVPPVVTTPTFSVNPKAVTQTTVVGADANDDSGSIVAAEYFIGSDPGVGNGTAMQLSGNTISATIGTNLGPGVHTVSVRARDAAGNWSEPKSAVLVVYDPSGGFVTGGGWILPGGTTSEPGDLLPGLDGMSKANFGFVVRYQSGASTAPGGNLEFHYNVGDFHLQSSGMDWLVVTNTNWAKFQGLGTIAGASGLYPFRVDARDGDTGETDRLSIKIWAPGADPNLAEPIYKASGDVQGRVMIHR